MSLGPYRPDDVGHVEPANRRRRLLAPQTTAPSALERPADRLRLVERARVIEWVALALGAALLLGFWQLQMVHGARYAELAEGNRHRQTRVRATRGLILDRNGEILATNRPAYEVALVREDVEDLEATLAFLAGVLEESSDVLSQRLERQRGLPRFRPAVLASGVSRQQVVAIEARRREYPGVAVEIAPRRYYPNGPTAAHALGHVGEISPRQLQAWDARFRMGDIVGQLGVESVYNGELSGTSGARLALVNSVGREIQVLDQAPAEPGETVVLTLDLVLQRRAEELLEGHRGAMVLLDVADGGILAMASTPAFDPNAFAARFSVEEWESLINDPGKPLQNRALTASLAPGSIFKLVMATAGLEEGIISTDTTFFCPGGRTYYGRLYRCLGQHGNISVVDALAYSCNSFFYELGVKLGRQRIVRWAQHLGLGSATGIDLPEEEGGIVPSDEWLERMGLRFYPGETVSISIGQGRLAVSPLQLANLAASVGSGMLREPHLLEGVEESSYGGGGSRTFLPSLRTADFSERTRQTVLRGMAGSAAYGSSRRAAVPGIQIGGKTGTAQVASAENVAEDNEDRPERLRNHAWFVAVAPVDAPQVALAVFLEHGGSGGGVAAPLGGQLLAEYFGLPADRVRYQEIPVTPEREQEPER